MTTTTSPTPAKVSLQEKFEQFDALWEPKIAARINDSLAKLVKFQDEFVWHHHDNEDEMFLVVKGSMVMQFRDQDVPLNEGEFIVVPRGIEHCPKADEVCHVMLFEPATTLNTGNITNERTLPELNEV